MNGPNPDSTDSVTLASRVRPRRENDPAGQSAPPIQFHLRTLMGVTSLLCVLLAILAAVGANPIRTLFGFSVILLVTGVTAFAVEWFYTANGRRPR